MQQQQNNTGMWVFLSVLVVVAFLALMFFYGLPFMARSLGTQFKFPDKVDINVIQPTPPSQSK